MKQETNINFDFNGQTIKILGLEESLEAAFRKAEEAGIESAKDLAKQGLPLATEKGSGEVFYRSITSDFNRCLSDVNVAVQNLGSYNPNETDKKYDKKEQDARDAEEEAVHKLGLAERAVEKSEKDGNHLIKKSIVRLNIIRIVCILLGGCEVMYSFRTLQGLGLTPMGCLMLACIIACTNFFVAELTPFILSKVQTRKKKILVLVGIIGSMLTFFTVLSLTRSAGTIFVKFSFILINMLILITSMILMLKFYVTKAERQLHHTHNELVKKQEERFADKVEATDRIYHVQKERSDEHALKKAIRTYSVDLEKKIRDEYIRIYGIWCTTNIQYRQSADYPAFFSQNPTPLMFNYLKVKYEFNYN